MSGYEGSFTMGGPQYGNSFVPANSSSQSREYTATDQDTNFDASGKIAYPFYDPSTGHPENQDLGYKTYPTSHSAAPYSRAVANFATSRLYEKAGKTSGSFSSNSRGRYYENQGWNNTSSTNESKSYYCEMCKISCIGKSSYNAHCAGYKHMRKEESLKTNKPITISAVTIMCQVCDIPCSGPETYNAHIIGNKHKRVVNLHLQLGKPVPELSPLPLAKTPVVTPTPANAVKCAGTPRMNFADGGQLNTNKKVDDVTDECIQANTASSATSADPKEGEGDENGTPSTRPLKEKSHSLNPGKTQDGFDVSGKTWDDSVEPIGIECIETQTEDGRPSFYCKICACKIGDPASKERHVRGKKHKYAYKTKVDKNYTADNPNNIPESKTKRPLGPWRPSDARLSGYSPYGKPGGPPAWGGHPSTKYYGGYVPPSAFPLPLRSPAYGWSPRKAPRPFGPPTPYYDPYGPYYGPPPFGYVPPSRYALPASYDYYWPPHYEHRYPFGHPLYYPFPQHPRFQGPRSRFATSNMQKRTAREENEEDNEDSGDNLQYRFDEDEEMEFETLPRRRRHSV